jgi:vacuolar-type H+-ATPase subunit I/STV1
MKNLTKIYITLALLGAILIGLGCGISIFEISTFKTADYHNDAIASSLPPLEYTTQTLEVTLTGDTPFQLDNYWDVTFTIQVDDTLQDKVLLQIESAGGCTDFYLDQRDTNYYVLSFLSNDLEKFRLALQLAKEGYILQDLPPAKVTILMNQKQADQFQLNERSNQTQTIETSYQESLDEMEDVYQERINALEEQKQDELDAKQTEYDSQLEQMQQDYDAQLQAKDDEIADLQQQLEEALQHR